MPNISALAGTSLPESAKKGVERWNCKMELKKFSNTETNGIKPRNGHLEDPKLVQKPCSNQENKGIKQGTEQLEKEHPKPVITPSPYYLHNKGIKPWNGHLENPKLVQKPCSNQENMANLQKLMGKLAKANYPYCVEVSEFEILAKIGQGTFGEVFKARHRTTGKKVALKKILMENEKEGFPITALREVKILQKLKHDNIVNFIDVCRSTCFDRNNWKTFFYLVFDFCEHDLAGLLSDPAVKFSLGEIKMVLKQLLSGLYFIHTNKILHRDIKAANILITKTGMLKIADFGLAKAFSYIKNPDKPNRFTNRVITLWYRPPELLLGENNYGTSVDLWGVGCVMAEMWLRKPLMQGGSEQHQLTLISHLCGSITPETFPDFEKLPLCKSLILPQGHKRKIKERLEGYLKDPNALDLIDKFLALDPAKRIDTDTALIHDFFWTDPMPCDLSNMLQFHSKSMFEYFVVKKKEERLQAGPRAQPHPTANDGQYHERVF